MTHEEIFNLLRTLNIPVAYDHFNSNKNIEPPFIIYREAREETFKSDNYTYYKPYNYEIELITKKKDTTLQERVETLLNNNKIPYDVETEIWDDNENIYHNFYNI